ncbi:hypothetical protein I8751_05080 [Nostocaceae cyanobacterium CENA357]|uniref:Uncharacterized protein n=1 Tax=Atlanticothrix silvestris CENA357 TaxID=1725252 RepID=A0A8J7H933_9CYAN|nr:hypothetical protein [Atlanticothrix silvestris]MBH8551759.1 hypothetical protein [Atlanticothrix silvestris CENA357]
MRIAFREYRLKSGVAHYLLIVNRKAIRVIEAKQLTTKTKKETKFQPQLSAPLALPLE